MIYNTETQHILLCPNTVLVLELLEYQELLDQVMNTNGHTSSASKVTQKKTLSEACVRLNFATATALI